MKPLYTNEQFDLAKSKEKLPCECYNCQNIFYVYKSNIKHELANNRGRIKFCSVKCYSKHANKSKNIPCTNCGNVFLKKLCEIKDKNFCSRSCAGTFNGKKRKQSDETKIKIKSSLSKFYSENISGKKRNIDHDKICLECSCIYHSRVKKSKFCTIKCASSFKVKNCIMFTKEYQREMGLKSAQRQKETRRSKNEIYFGELCKQKFNDVKFNEPIFNGWDADVIIEDLKLAVLWNGVWHYKKITTKHSVEQVQNRDNIKLKEIEKKGYKYYIIKDMGKHKKDFVESEFKKMLVFLKII